METISGRPARLAGIALIIVLAGLACRSTPISTRFRLSPTPDETPASELEKNAAYLKKVSLPTLLADYALSYQEDFSDTPDDFDIHSYQGEAAEHTFHLKSGVLFWEVDARDHSLESFLPYIDLPLPNGSFYLESTLLVESDNNPYGAGVLFRTQENNDCYYAGFDKTGAVETGGFIDGSWSYFTETVRADLFKRNELNRIGVLSFKGSYFIYVNDSLVTWFEDDSLTGGGWGLGTDVGAGDDELVTVDHIRILQSSKASLPTRIATIEQPDLLTRTITPTATIFVVKTPRATFEPAVLPTRMDTDGTWSTLEGEENGLKYRIPYPDVFEPVESAEQPTVCLKAPEKLCVVLQMHEGSWSSSEEFGDSTVEELNHTTKYFQLINSQEVDLTDGQSAYRVNYYNNMAGRRYETTRLFVAAGAVGVDLAVEGEIKVVEVYRDLIDQILAGFSIQ